MALSDFLKFDNAALFWVSSFLFVMLALYLRWLIVMNGGWHTVVDYFRYQWLRNQGDGAEITIAFGTVILGIAVRSGSIALWRVLGSHADQFPYIACAVGDAFQITGMLCAIRVAAIKRPVNWPWMVAGITGLLFGMLSLLFPLGASESTIKPAPVLGDCGVEPARPRAWLYMPVSRPYDGGVICPADPRLLAG